MRRIRAILLSVIIIVGIFGSFAGCLKGTNDSALNQVQWLVLVNEAFGMGSYASDDPHVKSVSADNEHFTTVQVAYEWGLISGNEFDPGKKLTKGYAAFSLVKAVGFADTTNQSDQEIAQFAADNGYVSFSYDNEKDFKKFASEQEYEESLKKAKQIWLNPVFEEKEEVQYKEGVISLVDDPEVKSNAAIIDNKARIPMGSAENIKVGDVYLLPSNIPNNSITNTNGTTDSPSDSSTNTNGTTESPSNSSTDDCIDVNNQGTDWQINNGTIIAHKAEKIEYADGYAIITNSEGPLTIEDAIQEMDISGRAAPDLTTVPITDGAGNIINGNSETSSSNVKAFEAPSAKTMQYNSKSTMDASYLGATSSVFKVDGFEVDFKVKKSSFEISLKGDIPVGKSGYKVTPKISYEIKDISVDYDYKIKWFNLTSAYAKLNYTIVEKAGLAFTWDEKGSFYKDNREKFNWANVKSAELKEKAGSDGTKTIKISSFPIATGGVGSINLDIKLRLKVSGEVELVVTTRNSKGLELKNGNVRVINEEKQRDVDVAFKAKLELTMYIGLSCRVLGINIIGVGVEGGVGAEVKATIHLVDKDHVEDSTSLIGNSTVIDKFVGDLVTGDIHVEVCYDLEVYGIVRFTVDVDSAIYKMAKGFKGAGALRFSPSMEIYGKDNAKIKELCAHWEDGKKVDKCTKKFRKSQESESSESTSNSPQSGDILDIKEYYANLFINDTYTVSVTELPKGYQIDDVIFESSNATIATVDPNGLVKAVSAGTTTVTASTKDKKFTVHCSITVNGVHVEVTFHPLKVATM